MAPIGHVIVAAAVIGSFAAEPFPASPGRDWLWVPVNGTKCMNGKQTGVYIRSGAPGVNKVAIYMNGGGACFNEFTCLTCASSPQPGKPGSSGIFSTQTKNPLNDFFWINVPYCTGDVHLGNASKKLAGEHRYFHGRANLAAIMERAVATFPKVDVVFITGESAGGFGAYSNYAFLRGHWTSANGNADTRGIMVDDSGPILDDTAIPPCLQELWRRTWNINSTLPAGCPCTNPYGNMVAGWQYYKQVYPRDSRALISSLNDGVISTFFSFGLARCHNPVPIGYDKLGGGLKRLATSVPVYIIPGSTHTHTSSDEFFTRTVNHTKLYEWVAQLISDGPDPGSVIPADDGHGFHLEDVSGRARGMLELALVRSQGQSGDGPKHIRGAELTPFAGAVAV